MTAVVSPPAPVATNPPPSGWLHTGLHVAVVVLGALLAGTAAFTHAVAGGAQRSVAIGAGVVVALGALLSWANGHVEAVAADEVRFRAWMTSHGPEAQMALKVAQQVQSALPANLANRLSSVEQTAGAALALARAVPVATVTGTPVSPPPPAPVDQPPAAS